MVAYWLASNTPGGGWRAAWSRSGASLARARESGRTGSVAGKGLTLKTILRKVPGVRKRK